MRATQLIMTFAALVAAGACAQRDPVDDNADLAAANAPPPTSPIPIEPPPANGAASAAMPASGSTDAIPASLQGRWGLTPADCTSRRGDAKGLLVITPDELRFYESRAVPSPGAQVGSDSISGNFRFTGEGQSWTKFETLERQEEKLVRTETESNASFAYAKC